MKHLPNPKPFAAAATLALLAACSSAPPAPTPAPTPTPVVTPTPSPTPTLARVYEHWEEAPATPGNWSYRIAGSQTQAIFSAPNNRALAAVRCESATSTVTLQRFVDNPHRDAVPMRILTETSVRLLTAEPSQNPIPSANASLPASDGLLDAIALSKGRFALELAGEEVLYLPSWTEVSRVVEDCR